MNAAAPGGAGAPVPPATAGYRRYVLAVLLGVFILHHIDRSILLVLLEPIRKDFALSDTQLGLLSGLGYALPFALAGLPLGALADRVRRTSLLAVLVVIWSAFTALGGLAPGFLSLLAARAAVGAAEAGAPPTIISILSDTYPAKSRPSALSVLFIGPLIGLLAGSVLGGLVAAHFGWQGALLIAGIPGLLVALLIRLTLREPIRGAVESSPQEIQAPVPVAQILRFTLGSAPLRDAIGGMVAASIVSIGFMSWIPVALMRVHHLPVGEAGFATALAAGLPGGLGTVLAAWLAARFTTGHARPLLRLCGIGVGLAVPFGIVGALSASLPLSVASFALWSIASTLFIGPGHSIYLGAVPPRMRGTLAALVVVLCNLLGTGLGPQIVGSLSEALRNWGDIDALPHALAALAIAGILPSLLFIRGAARARPEATGRLGTIAT